MTQFTSHILRFESLPSTNLEAARRAAEGAPEGLCVLASEQTAGRGRLERQWVSPKGAGLYFSIVLRPQLELSDWPLLTLLTAVAVQNALFQACNLSTDIKWPNDLMVNNRKLCGILAETLETPLGRAVVVGIGINLNHDSVPSALEAVATSVETETGELPDREVVLQKLVPALISRYLKLQGPDGPAGVVREWCVQSSYCQGKRIQITTGTESFRGTTRGLESDGALRVETDEGETRIVRAGDVMGVRLFDYRAP